MIRFSAQALIYFGASREDAYSGPSAYFFFEKQPNVKKNNFDIYLKTNNIETVAVTNTDGECSVNAKDLP